MRQDKEERIESVFTELSMKHKEQYTTPQLKIWAHMIVNGLHESYECPPNILMKIQKKRITLCQCSSCIWKGN